MLKLKLILFISLTIQSILSQAQESVNERIDDGDKVSFIANIDIKNATKDGIYLNDYVVNIPYKNLLALHGKKVRIKGRVTIVKGIKHFTGEEKWQGRQEDTKHILRPRIKVVD